MKFRYFLLLLTASTVSANEYQTFTSFNYTNTDDSLDVYSLDVQHYFDAKSDLGPLGQFEYINTTSSLFGSYYDSDYTETTELGGEYFSDNFLIGARFSRSYDMNASSISLGYLVNDDFLIKAQAINPINGDTFFNYSAKYSHQLDGVDYLGFSVSTDEDFNTQSYSSTYFKQLDNQSFFKGNIFYFDGERVSFWSANVSYYFNKITSVLMSFDENEDYGLGVNHFFNENYSIRGNYSHNRSISGDYYIYSVSFSARF